MRIRVGAAAIALMSCAAPPAPSRSPDLDAAAPDEGPPTPPADAPFATDLNPAQRDAARKLDAAPAFTPASCMQDAAYLCEDFESGQVGRGFVVRRDGNNKLVVDSTRPRRGKYSLHLTAFAGAELGVGVMASPRLPAGPTKLFVRAYLYVAPSYVSALNFLWVFGTDPKAKMPVMAMVAGTNSPWLDPRGKRHAGFSYFGPATPFGDGAAVNWKLSLMPESWQCWEWQLDGEAQSWRLWVDGVKHLELLFQNMAKPQYPVPIDNTILFGTVGRKEEPDPIEAWYDDIVVSSQPIGCEVP